MTSITNGTQTMSASGPVAPTGGTDVSQFADDWTVKVRVTNLTAAGVRLVVEESTNGTNYVPIQVWDINGQLTGNADLVKSFRRREANLSKVGQASSLLRVTIAYIVGPGSVAVEGWIF